MRTESESRWLVVACCALWLLGAPSALCFVTYDPWIVDQGSPVALSDTGFVAGVKCIGGDSPGRAVLWHIDVPYRPKVLGPPSSSAGDVNDAGQVLVFGDGPYAMLWYEGNYTDLGSITAHAVNNLGQVLVGGGIWDDGETRPTAGIQGADLNDQGQVTGWLYEHGAVIWDDGEITEVGPAAAENSGGASINELGQVVGFASVSDGRNHSRAFFWDGMESVIYYATLGGKNSAANAINDLAQIVGGAEVSSEVTRAVLWEDGVMRDLNDLLTEPFPYTLVEAVDINNRGQIACRAEDASGKGWVVLLNPIPEPGTVLLVALGAAAALRRRRRRHR